MTLKASHVTHTKDPGIVASTSIWPKEISEDMIFLAQSLQFWVVFLKIYIIWESGFGLIEENSFQMREWICLLFDKKERNPFFH